MSGLGIRVGGENRRKERLEWGHEVILCTIVELMKSGEVLMVSFLIV